MLLSDPVGVAACPLDIAGECWHSPGIGVLVMFWYLPFYIFAGSMLYLFPELGLWLGIAYLAGLLLPRLWRSL